MTRLRFSDPRDWLETILAVMLIAAVLVAMMANYQTVSFEAYFIFCGMGLCFAVVYRILLLLVIPNLLRESDSRLRRLTLNLAGIVIAAGVGGELATRVLLHWGFESQGDLSRLRIPVFFIGLGVLISVRLIEFGNERLRDKVRAGQLREERTRRQALRAELTALQARTDPHFLFNSLNTVAGLIEEDPDQAVEVLTRLSGLYRHTLHGSRVDQVTLEEEMQAASTFLEIQSLRFGDRLNWKMSCDPGLEKMTVPPLILQPLVENAVLHGASNRRSNTVTVQALSREGFLKLEVRDQGPGPGHSLHRGSGTSLSDLADRLNLLYGHRARLETTALPEGGFGAEITLPLSVASSSPRKLGPTEVDSP